MENLDLLTSLEQNIGKTKTGHKMIFVKFYDKKSESSEITYFYYNYDPVDHVPTNELINNWVSEKIGHDSFEIENFEFVLPDKCK